MKFEGRNLPQAGDLLLYKANGRSWFFSRLISKYSKAFGEDSKGGKYCHVALIDHDIPKSNQTFLVEMTWPRARRVPLDLSYLNGHYDLELWRPNVPLTAKLLAMGWANNNLGMKYDLSTIFFGLGDDKHKEVCSTFVYKAYLAAGITLYPNGIKEKLVSPSELATSSMMERVW